MTRRKRRTVLDLAVDATNRARPFTKKPDDLTSREYIEQRNGYLHGYVAGWRASQRTKRGR